MIIIENGQKILRLSLQKAFVSMLVTVFLSAIGFFSLGFRTAFSDHFRIGKIEISVNAIEKRLDMDFVKKETYENDQKLYAKDQELYQKDITNINNNMETLLKIHMK